MSHYDAILGNFSTAYIQSQSMYIASKVFPIINVDKQSNKFYTFDKNDWFRDEAKARADSTESAGGGYNLSTDNYSCDVYAFHKDVGDQVLSNSDSILEPMRHATEFVTQRLLLKMELDWTSTYFVDAVWGTSYTPSNLWSDYAASDPIGDIETGRETILASTGFEPNVLVLGYHAYVTLKNHPDFVDRVKYTNSDPVSDSMLAQYFGVDKIYVSKAIYSPTVEGAATPTYQLINGDHALLLYVDPSPGLLSATAGVTFAWNGGTMPGASVAMKRFRMERIAAERIEGQICYDQKIVATDLGYFLHQVTT